MEARGADPGASRGITTLPRARSASARRKQRDYRARIRRGEIVLKVSVSQIALAEALIAAGWLCADDTLNRHALEEKAANILAEWIGIWQGVC